MGKETIVSKGKYTYAQPAQAISLKQYMIVRGKDGKKKLLLRFANDRAEGCRGFAFVIYRLDAKGAVLSEERYDSTEGREFAPNATFGWDQHIPMEEKCTDFRIRLLYASYGNYTYRFEDAGTEVMFEKVKSVGAEHAVQATQDGLVGTRKRTSRSPWLYVAIALMAMAVAFGVFGILLRYYIDSHQEFSIAGVQYEFVTDDKENGEVIITGYNGLGGSLLIPSAIEGHRVVGIREHAFAENYLIQRVRVEGVAVSAGAFRNCYNLTEVQLEDVATVADEAFYNCDALITVKCNRLESIGQSAFADCERLREVDIAHDDPAKQLSVGLHAFAECGMLETVSIRQTIVYPQFQSIFRNDYNIQQLHLKNFAYTLHADEVKQPAHKGTISMLFADDGTLARPHQLTTLSIDYMDEIAVQFCKGFNRLAKVQINCSEIAHVAEGAFYGCASLAEISSPVPFTTVGKEAFFSTALTYFDGSALISVGESAFQDCAALADLNVKSGTALTDIGKSAFSGCASLSSFVLAKEIAEIPPFLFNGCRSLQTVTFESGSALTAVGESAFRGCTALRSISLPGGLLTIGENAFSGCSALSAVSIPTSVTSYGNYAFYQCTALTSVPFGTQLRQIGSYAFGATGLTSVEIPNTVEEIGMGAFMGCESLTALTVPFFGKTANATSDQRHIGYLFGSLQGGQSGLVPDALATVTLNAPVTVLDPYAFYSCSGLRTVRFAATVSEIGEYAFAGCTSLSDFDFSAVNVIGRYAFSNTAFTALILHANVTAVGEGAFSGCTKLQSVSLPQDWTVLPARLLAECGKLHSFTIPAGVTVIPSGFFYKCTALAQIALPAGIHSIGEDAFGSCTNLTSIVLPDGLRSIGSGAFAASGLRSLSVPVGVQHIAEGAFSRCTALAELTVPFVGETVGSEQSLAFWFGVGNNKQLPECLTRVIVDNPNGVQVLSNNFRNAVYLEEVILREGVTQINSSAFSGCSRLRYISLPATLTRLLSDPFDQCYRLFEVDNYSKLKVETYFPQILELRNGGGARSPIAEVDGCRFARYSGTWYLIDYGVDTTVIELKTGSFSFNGGLVSSWRIPAYLAYGDETLTSVTLSGGVTEIGAYAFYRCTRLGAVTLPDTLTGIGEDAFFGCSGLYDVYNRSKLTLTEGKTDHGYVARYAVAVHTGSDTAVSAEVTLDNGLVFRNSGSKWLLITYRGSAERLTLSALRSGSAVIGTYRIAENAFAGNSTLRTLIIGSEVRQIQQSAFANCNALREVSMSGNMLKELEPYAFYQCQRLRRITMSEGITAIGDHAFYYCSNLESIVMPTMLTEIGAYAFANCGKLISITIPTGVRTIGEYAFSNCKQLFEVYDLSTSLQLVQGSNSNGEVARYAAKVYTGTGESLQRVTIDDCYFIQAGGVWYLYSCATDISKTVMILPDGPAGGYVILPRAFADATFEGVIVPVQVTGVRENPFAGVYNLSRIYYEGNSSKWSTVAPSGLPNSVYFYDICVHQPERWTFRGNLPSTEYCTMSGATVTREATCTRGGEETQTCLCANCSYRITSATPLLPHQFENDVCTGCSKKRTFITNENYAALEANGTIKNASDEPFTFSDGCFTSTNKADGSSSEWSFTAKQAVKLSFTYGASSESDRDYLLILVDGQIRYRATGTYSADKTVVELELSAGQTVVFRYQKDSSISQGADEGYVKDIYYYT